MRELPSRHPDALLEEIERLKAQVERLTQLNDTLALRYDATKSMLDGCAKEIEEMEAEVERLTKSVMHSPAAQLKLKELEGKTTFDEINPDNQ
jgi:archaellum component FlaC